MFFTTFCALSEAKGMDIKMKVLFTTNTPASYRVDFFNELGKFCDLTVLFETQYDKSRDKKWASDNYENFNAIFMKGIQKGEADAICFGVLKYLNKSYDMIIIGAYHTPTARIAIEYMRLKSITFVISSDGGFVNQHENKLKYLIKKHYISAADGWLSTGSVTTEYLCHYGADRNKVHCYPFTSVRSNKVLNEPVSEIEKKWLREQLGMKEDRICISVGQFIHRKGFDLLLNAASEMDRSTGFYIIGGIPTQEYLDQVKKHGLTNVHFVGFMDKEELVQYYKAADIFVLPTREDIWGLVVNEAMGYGLPVITTDRCVAGLEMIHEGQNGFIVPIDTVKELREAMESTINADLYSMSVEALKTAQQYTIEKMAKSHIDYIEEKVKQ